VVHHWAAARLASPEQPEEQLLVTCISSAPSTPSLAGCGAEFAAVALTFIITSHAASPVTPKDLSSELY